MSFKKSVRANVVFSRPGRSDRRDVCLLARHVRALLTGRVGRAPRAREGTREQGGCWHQWSTCVTVTLLWFQVNEVTVEQLVQQYPHITFSTVLQDCKRTLERAYQMGWTPNMSTASS